MASACQTTTSPDKAPRKRALALAAAAVPVLALAELPLLVVAAPAELPAWATLVLAGSALSIAGLWYAINRASHRIAQLEQAVEAVIEGQEEIDIPRIGLPPLRPLAERIARLPGMIAEARLRQRRRHEINPETELPRRAFFKNCVEQLITAPSAQGCLIHIDIANLKVLCERYGQTIAGPVLSRVAMRIAAATPIMTLGNNIANLRSEQAARLPVLAHTAHTQFVLHVPDYSSIEDIERQTTQIISAFTEPVRVGDRQIPVEIALGVARYPDDGESFEDIANKAALAAMRAASPAFPDCLIIYDSGLMQDIKNRDGLEQDLHQAIADRSLQIVYQPKVHSSDWSNAGVEALVRWRHPTRGEVSPGDFIPIAEASGLIVDLGMFVMAEAARQCAEWSRQGRLIGVSINVAAGQVARPDFADKVLEIIELNDCPPTLVTIEITETMAHSNNNRFVEQLHRLRAAGLKLAIDDFGIGYSNLAHLAELDFDALKMDRSLISKLETSSRTVEVCRAIVNLGKALGCKVVAEGVETAGQAAAASKLGCDEIQGYYVSAELNAADYIDWQDRVEATSLIRTVRDIFGEGIVPKFAHDELDPDRQSVENMLRIFSKVAGD
ncbi:GGDEF domain-containing protein [Pseudohoeflea suaedae]|uniref:GGDEF domain-containing protein n=1 Tax=Pseudohoeflea suaedae TaxID=877384 RepID=A0A4R5PHE4_9HYPH|nr:bifunctional diguanylate cyclase/phosphodiesterase [Pseudohoeflea suaedae]TDH34318.1 GGDEF domain-containing protein [Pseudohoeflea suaedae]